MTMSLDLLITVRDEPGYVLVTVAGEIDIATVPQLRAQLAELTGSGPPLVVDLGGVRFIDASGLGALAAAARSAAGSGAGLHVVSAGDRVRRLFAITGLDQQIPLARTVTEALARLPGGPDPAAPGQVPRSPGIRRLRPATEDGTWW
jgi:anti-sigma B factor antagonist